MAILKLHTISGMENIFSSAIASAVASGNINESGGALGTWYTSTSWWQGNTGYTHLSYDPAEDVVIISNGREQNATFSYLTLYGAEARVNRYPIQHVAVEAKSLDPGAGDQALEVKSVTSYNYPDSGGAFGFCYDHNTGRFYQQWWHFLLESSRYAKDTFYLGYGNNPPIPIDYSQVISWTFAQGQHSEAYGDNVLSDAVTKATGYVFSPGFVRGPLGAVRFDDIGIMAYGDTYGRYNWISCRKLGVGSDDDVATWRGTRMMPFGPPFCIAPVDIDRCIVVWWANSNRTSPLVYTMFTYDRPSARLFLEDFGKVPTDFTYTWPLHKGWGTFDTKRGKLILLSPNPDDFDAVVFDEFCHAGNPTALTVPVPLDPFLENQEQAFGVATYTDSTPQGANVITVDVNGPATINYPVTARTDGSTGAGTFTITWDSGAETGTVALATSAFSVGVSASFAQGVRYGEEALAILSTTTTFTLSATLSATQATSAVQNVVILPRNLTPVSDAVGAGPPRTLSYPTGALTSPIQYEINPQQTENMGANPLTRPLYASKRTLTKTATVQFVGDATDLVITETWLGGGDRIACSVSFFAALYDYYNNPPNFQSEGFITYEPRDLNSNAYKVVITDLSIGGQGAIKLDNLYKAGQGWIHETMTMQIKLVGNA